MTKPTYKANQSPPSLVLRFMREKRKLSLLFVAKELGIKAKHIDYMEHGRRVITDEEILPFLKCYDFSLEAFNDMLKLNPLNKQMANRYFLTRP
ncbi:MAG: transcriptional regulator with XRE-family HTH domain [Thermoproteota archaeon]|jgi:transcriptional regulator with XRE-family HTH domain